MRQLHSGGLGDPSIRPCGLQRLLFGLAIRVYHNLIRSLVQLVRGALVEEGKSVLTCGKLRSQQQSLIFMMRFTLLSTSIKVANVLIGVACSPRNTSVCPKLRTSVLKSSDFECLFTLCVHFQTQDALKIEHVRTNTLTPSTNAMLVT